MNRLEKITAAVFATAFLVWLVWGIVLVATDSFVPTFIPAIV